MVMFRYIERFYVRDMSLSAVEHNNEQQRHGLGLEDVLGSWTWHSLVLHSLILCWQKEDSACALAMQTKRPHILPASWLHRRSSCNQLLSSCRGQI
jgi:hypothetical protein